MFNRHCAVNLGFVSIVAALTGVMLAPARAQTMPAYTALPQSMALSGAPTAYPSTADRMASGVGPLATSPSGDVVFGTTAPAPSDAGDVNVERPFANGEPWTWQFVPTGLMYKPDLASGTECRLASQWDYIRGQGWFWNPVAGGRAGLLRYGSQDEAWPQGWQLDVAGAAFPRLDANRNMVSTDFRVAVPLTTRQGPWEFKFGYTHLSSHLGDLFMLANPDYPRINYVRDSLAMGVAFYLNPDLRLYSESGWAFHTDGGGSRGSSSSVWISVRQGRQPRFGEHPSSRSMVICARKTISVAMPPWKPACNGVAVAATFSVSGHNTSTG